MQQILLTIFISLFSFSGTAFAQDYKTGYARYLQKKYADAESILRNVLSSKKMGSLEKAQTLKILGLAQYMQGKRLEAARSFGLAKKVSPSLKLSKSEIQDNSAYDFYNSIEGPKVKTKSKQPVKKKPPQKKPVPKANPRAQKQQRRAPALPAKKDTTLLILSNALDAKILVDGAVRGRAGDMIGITPGKRKVEVYAPGFNNAIYSLNILPEKLNKYKVELKRLTREKAKLSKDADQKRNIELEKRLSELERKKRLRVKAKYRKEEMKIAPINYFLPFGIPQYAQSKNWSGLSFTLIQASSLTFGIFRILESNNVIDDTNTVLDERLAQEQQISNSSDKQAFAAETDAYYENQISTIDNLRLEAYIGFSIFAVSWLVSGLEAYVNPPIYYKKVLVKKSALEERKERNSEISWSFNPSYISPTRRNQGYYALNFRLSF